MATIRTYYRDDNEDIVEVIEDTASTTYYTYTSGSRDTLYCGPDAEAAQESLELSDEQWAALLASDPAEEEIEDA